jgi:hypothetical protein
MSTYSSEKKRYVRVPLPSAQRLAVRRIGCSKGMRVFGASMVMSFS